MNSKKALLLPKHQKIFEKIGENIKLARKRRKLTTEQVSERTGINRSTLYRIEKGDPAVAIGLYFSVFRVLNLHDDFRKLALDDEFGRKLQDLELLSKKMARGKFDIYVLADWLELETPTFIGTRSVHFAKGRKHLVLNTSKIG